MASALRFAARKMCSRALQRPPQPFFPAAVKEEQRRISHGGSSLRRFTSSESPNLLNNNKHGAQPAARAAESASLNAAESTPWWSIYHPKFIRNVFLYSLATSSVSVATLYVVARVHGGPIFRDILGLEPNPRKEDD